MPHALLFLVNALCVFFSTLFMLRLLMQWQKVSFSLPVGGFVLSLTNWAVLPMRRVIPGIWGVDWASITAAFIPHVLYAVAFLYLLKMNAIVGVQADQILLAIAVLTLQSFLRNIIYLFMVLLFIKVILSWVNPHSPLAYPLTKLTYPLLSPVQRLIPPISGIDLSPLIVILILQALLFLL
ncbi:MAG: YggT family protein [Betaproteobacteria bacterium]|nr:YggT family protein [Betaproteobacteria bacterium]